MIRLEKRAVADLRPYDRNVKQHGDDDVRLIAASIERFGFNDPIGISEDGEIIEGHGRYDAALMLGMEHVPVIVLEGMTERQRRLYRIAHNKIALSSTFDFEALVTILRNITGGDISMQDLGFSETTANTLLNVVFAEQGAIKAESIAKPEPFDVIWDTKDQKTQWDAFMRRIMDLHPGMTMAEARSQFIRDCGILEGERAAVVFAHIEGEGNHQHVG